MRAGEPGLLSVPSDPAASARQTVPAVYRLAQTICHMMFATKAKLLLALSARALWP
jgi:hypothetical protein